jgi:hypothetical protein
MNEVGAINTEEWHLTLTHFAIGQGDDTWPKSKRTTIILTNANCEPILKQHSKYFVCIIKFNLHNNLHISTIMFFLQKRK